MDFAAILDNCDASEKINEELALCENFFNYKEIKHKILKHAVLFKSVIDSGIEPYSVLNTQDIGIAVSIMYVMDFEYLNQDLLKEYLENHSSYSGIIFTSPRAVKAIDRLFKNNEDKKKYMNEWIKKSNYSIGKETSSLTEACLGIQTMGKQSGNSEELVNFILNDAQKSSCLPFLFPCSQIRKNTLIHGLSNGGIHVEEIICYNPVPRHFRDDWCYLHTLIHEVANLQGTGKSEPDILVFFSPSVVKIVQNELSGHGFELSKYQVIALGPSTGKELSSFGVSANNCDEPSPQGVGRLLKTMST